MCAIGLQHPCPWLSSGLLHAWPSLPFRCSDLAQLSPAAEGRQRAPQKARHLFALSGYLCGDMMPTEKVPVAQHNDAELVAECLDSSVWDGSNMHHRTTEPTLLAYDWNRNMEVAAPAWMPGTETRKLAAQLPDAIARYMAHCEREHAENDATQVA